MSYYEDSWCDRAVRLYFKELKAAGYDDRSINQPCRYSTNRKGRTVRIENGNGLLAKYRIQAPDNKLVRVVPEEI